MEKQQEKPAPVPELNEIVNTNEKDVLIENYLPNLSNYQKVIKKFEIDLGNDKKKISDAYELSPNGNFIKEKGYFLFYNDNLKILIELYKAYLEEYIKQNDFALFFKRNNLNEVFNEKDYKYISDADNSYNPLKLVSGLISKYWKQDIIEKSDILSFNLNELKKEKESFDKKEKMSAVKISENLFDEKLSVHKFNSKYFEEIECLKNENIDDIKKLNLLDKKIDELKKEIKPENSLDNMTEFCFVINIISEYLSNFERSFETKQFDLLKIMNTIRIKIDYFLLDYRYKFVENESPILNIKIKRYKILCDSPSITGIYFEKGEARNFKRNLREELDKKARNIKNEYQFQDIITIDEIINIGRNNNFNRLEDIIDGDERQIKQKNYELETKKNEYITFIAKESLNFAFGDNNKKINYNNNGVTKQISSNEMNQFLISDNAIKEKNENTNTTDGEKKESPKEDSEKILEKRKENLNNLGIDSKNMSNDIIDKISKSFQMLQDLNKIKDEIEILEKKKKRIEDKFNYGLDFFNALKLYCLMENKHIEKDDFNGIILEEKNKDQTYELREYSVHKLIGLNIVK